ncbi:zf-HC2 domain-containing protein [Roseateles sp. BYS180W]|uniref:Zf-HC2 domain-containing protein n=1 Tax=Roseateles rivi TaxID=3299028 RepID=A0ABW7FXW4_9BURK
MLKLPNCKEVALALLQARDNGGHPLPWRQRLHLRICRACAAFGRQVRLLDRAGAAWRHYSETDTPDPGASAPKQK